MQYVHKWSGRFENKHINPLQSSDWYGDGVDRPSLSLRLTCTEPTFSVKPESTEPALGTRSQHTK